MEIQDKEKHFYSLLIMKNNHGETGMNWNQLLKYFLGNIPNCILSY